jgi:hypothetical protein
VTANCLKTSIPKPYFCQCKVDIDQSHHIMRRLRSHSPSLSLPSLRLSLSLTLSPGSVKRNRQPARGFRFAASSARLPAHSFRRAAFCVLLPVRCFRRAQLRAASVPRACVRGIRTVSWGTAAPAPVRETARPHALLGTAARRVHGPRATCARVTRSACARAAADRPASSSGAGAVARARARADARACALRTACARAPRVRAGVLSHTAPPPPLSIMAIIVS